MDNIIQAELGKPAPPEALPDPIALWIGSGGDMKRVAGHLDAFVAFIHVTGEPPDRWRMTATKGVAPQHLSSLLVALQDHCKKMNIPLPKEQTATPGKVNVKSEPAGERQISIPLDGPDAAQKIEQALGGIMAPGATGQDIVEAARNQGNTPISKVPE